MNDTTRAPGQAQEQERAEMFSPAVEMIRHVWRQAQRATGHSWLRFNHALHDALRLAIESGMEFHIDDFELIAKEFRSGYWVGADTEWIYSTAVAVGNASAWKAYEHHWGRKPFIIPWATGGTGFRGGGGRTLSGTLPRVIIGSQFKWKDERVTVSSFNDEKGYLTAISHTRTGRNYCDECGSIRPGGEEKILHRFTITHADIKAAKAERKAKSIPATEAQP